MQGHGSESRTRATPRLRQCDWNWGKAEAARLERVEPGQGRGWGSVTGIEARSRQQDLNQGKAATTNREAVRPIQKHWDEGNWPTSPRWGRVIRRRSRPAEIASYWGRGQVLKRCFEAAFISPPSHLFLAVTLLGSVFTVVINLLLLTRSQLLVRCCAWLLHWTGGCTLVQ